MPKRKRLSKDMRQAVYEKYDGHCAYCGCHLEPNEMQVDHIESLRRHEEDEDADWLNDINNFNPACRQCNFYKDTCTVEGLRKNISGIIWRLEKVFIFRLALKYGLITVNAKPIEFYFEGNAEKTHIVI